MNNTRTVKRLQVEKMVVPVPITPVLSARKCVAVAMVRGTEPDGPPCRMTKPLQALAISSR
ncbi:MAG: hypothetical protein KA451_09745 [Methyloversatilis sp.]|nr:hypothetical protein [Methyloversatilis sp.]